MWLQYDGKLPAVAVFRHMSLLPGNDGINDSTGLRGF